MNSLYVPSLDECMRIAMRVEHSTKTMQHLCHDEDFAVKLRFC